MGEDGGAVEVVVAVDGVGAVDDGDPEAGGEGPPLHLVHHVGPLLGGGPLPGGAAAAAEDAADGEPGEGRGGGDAPVDLGHLGRLLREGHAAKQISDPDINGLVRVPIDLSAAGHGDSLTSLVYQR